MLLYHEIKTETRVLNQKNQLVEVLTCWNKKMMYENIQHLQKTFNSQDLFIYFIKFKVTEDRKGTVNIA